MQPLAEITDYISMIVALRKRVAEKNISMKSPATTELIGFPDRYLSKILGPKMTRPLSNITMGPILSLLGVKFIMVDDPEAIRRFAHRIEPRTDKGRNGAAITWMVSREMMRERGRKGGIKKGEAHMHNLERRKRRALTVAKWRAKKRQETARAHDTRHDASVGDGQTQG